tara:strand:- start:29 stop:397 length:369 start_codon:yes stop_codon:yes gene_type:complete
LELLLSLLKGKSLIAFEQFLEIDIRVGKIISAEKFPEARNPAYILRIDFGEDLGIKKSSAQITENYSLEELKGKLIMAVVNFPIKQIGPIRSEVLVLGVADSAGNIVLVSPEKNVQLGVRLH